jgi:hypothetical protein
MVKGDSYKQQLIATTSAIEKSKTSFLGSRLGGSQQNSSSMDQL